LDIQTVIPQEYINPLEITQNEISSSEICQLTNEFMLWLKSCFDQCDCIELLTARAFFVDKILAKLWCQHQLDEFQISLLAVGGYGRGELHPQSDVDILILTQEKIDKELEEKISAFITQLWDVKLDIGSSVRCIKECLKQAIDDVTVATNLMEMRQITGNEALTQQLQPLLNEDVFWTSKKFFVAKREEQKQRHEQYHGAAYTLEPNLKANPGALRDIQTIAWVAKRHFLANSLDELIKHNYLTHNEFFELLECQDYLWRMRFALHFVAGRSENRLLFDYQADVAEMMGFGDKGKLAVERMMKRFFRIIARVAELNTILLQHFDQAILKSVVPPKIEPIDEDFFISDGLIQVHDSRLFMRSVKIMRMFLIIAQNDKVIGIHSQTLRTLRNARRRLISGLEDYAKCRRYFMDIIKHPQGLGLSFKLMHRHGILGAYIPAWKNIVGQMQFDLFHAYSVDEHSYRLINNLYHFSLSKYNHQFPLCSKIVQRIRKPELLYIAGIFHDIAKGRGGDHAKLGAVDALAFCKSHQLNDHDGRVVAWMVKNHLLMSVTAQRRDISDENVINEFGNIVRDEAHLDYLYCLTVADMRATNESLWNSWKANLLDDLYDATKRAFRRGLEKPVDMRLKIRENQQQALALLQKIETISEQSLKSLWEEFKSDYFLRYSPEQICWHCQNILSHDKRKPLVLISPKPYRGGSEVFIFTKERANIFAATVALLGTKKLSILDAKIITSKTGYTLNTFVVLDNKGKTLDDRGRALAIANALSNKLATQTHTHPTIKPLTKKMTQFKFNTQVSFVKSPAKNKTMLEILTLDRPGLLARIAQVFQNLALQIHTAKITTFGEKAEDVFTLSNNKNNALSEEEKIIIVEKLTSELD